MLYPVTKLYDHIIILIWKYFIAHEGWDVTDY